MDEISVTSTSNVAVILAWDGRVLEMFGPGPSTRFHVRSMARGFTFEVDKKGRGSLVNPSWARSIQTFDPDQTQVLAAFFQRIHGAAS